MRNVRNRNGKGNEYMHGKSEERMRKREWKRKELEEARNRDGTEKIEMGKVKERRWEM